MIFLKTKLWLYREEKRTKRFFYWNKQFKDTDRKLSLAYSFKNPYQISRKYLQHQGAAEIHTYGETPLIAMRQIVQECGIQPQDHVIELGSGRGRTSFFLSEYVGCSVHAIERIPEFVQTAVNVAAKANCKNIQFSCLNMLDAPLKEATVIYLCGTCFSDQEISSLIDKFQDLSKDTKIITVSYPLSDYSNKFATIKEFSAPFPWGQTEIYLNQKIV